MSCRKRRRWHFRDLKIKTFLGEHAPRFPQMGRLCRANLSSPACRNQWPRMKEETCTRRGWGEHFKNCYCQGGGTIFTYHFLGRAGGGGKVLIHHTFLKTPAPLWDVINDWSLNILANFRLNVLITKGS